MDVHRARSMPSSLTCPLSDPETDMASMQACGFLHPLGVLIFVYKLHGRAFVQHTSRHDVHV